MARVLTKRVRDLFLEEFAKHGNLAAACRVVDVTHRAIHHLRDRNRFFASRMEEAKQEAVGRLEKEAYRRAIEGTANMVVSEGRVVRYKGKPLVKREYSDSLLAMLLRAHGGDQYKTRVDTVLHHEVDGNEVAAKLTDALARKFGTAARAAKKGND